MVGDSSTTASLLSKGSVGSPKAPLPVVIQTLPAASMTGAPPPIHTAPWLSPGRSETTKVFTGPPPSGAETTRPW